MESKEGLQPLFPAEGFAQRQADPGEPQGAQDPRPPGADVDGFILQTETLGPPSGEKADHFSDHSRETQASPANHPLAAEETALTPAPPSEEQAIPVPNPTAAEGTLFPAPPSMEEAIVASNLAAAEPIALPLVSPCVAADHAAAEPTVSPPSPGTAASTKLAAERAYRKAQEKQARAQERQTIKEMRR
jgi:hypothetical protein